MNLDNFIANQIARRPIEAAIVKRLVKAFAEAGKPIVKVGDGETLYRVEGLDEINREVFNLDEAWLITEDESWVFLTMGEQQDLICDYSINLEDIIAPVQSWIERTYDN